MEPSSQAKSNERKRSHVPEQPEDENKFRKNDGNPLEGDHTRSAVLEIVDVDDFGVDDVGEGRQEALEESEERRIIESPFRRCLRVVKGVRSDARGDKRLTHVEVPLPERQRVGDGEPVSVHLKIGGATAAKSRGQPTST